ncbi:unnamed protein product [Staurois parvus]|uniref:Uncharacterized protein n=1 Tax=Staurois parvus TaxID=386267 RepID=A0ABN9H228_9NEOB|nr:unnamed protein product [Staurois parvus]
MFLLCKYTFSYKLGIISLVYYACQKGYEYLFRQGRTDHLETRALPEGPGSVGVPMRCPWYLFHRLF